MVICQVLGNVFGPRIFQHPYHKSFISVEISSVILHFYLVQKVCHVYPSPKKPHSENWFFFFCLERSVKYTITPVKRLATDGLYERKADYDFFFWGLKIQATPYFIHTNCIRLPSNSSWKQYTFAFGLPQKILCCWPLSFKSVQAKNCLIPNKQIFHHSWPQTGQWIVMHLSSLMDDRGEIFTLTLEEKLKLFLCGWISGQ